MSFCLVAQGQHFLNGMYRNERAGRSLQLLYKPAFHRLFEAWQPDAVVIYWVCADANVAVL